MSASRAACAAQKPAVFSACARAGGSADGRAVCMRGGEESAVWVIGRAGRQVVEWSTEGLRGGGGGGGGGGFEGCVRAGPRGYAVRRAGRKDLLAERAGEGLSAQVLRVRDALLPRPRTPAHPHAPRRHTPKAGD